ncbi:sulfotransferase family protein [bacterium]|nr:sulfotransferase family protein [bacterium]
MTLFFVHIPKTGGTSFRKAAEEYYSKDKVIYDYNANAQETSPLIKSLFYKEKDLFKLGQRLRKDSVKFLSGHVNMSKYASIVGLCNAITFVRDPVQQIISHYRHFKRHYGYKGDFERFANEEKFHKIQSQMLACAPLEAYGFIGITEKYSSSIDLFNSDFEVNFSVKHENVTIKNTLESSEITEEMFLLAREATKIDRLLYENAVRIHNIRKYLHAKKLPYTYGAVTHFNGETVSGFAFQRNSNKAITVQIELNGNDVLGPKLASNFRPGLAAYKSPRGGFVGFDFSISKLCSGDQITCLVSDTGQVLWTYLNE